MPLSGRLFIVFVVLLLTACARPVMLPSSWQDQALNAVWPAVPQPPRIRLLRVEGSGPPAQKSGGRQFFDWLLGENRNELPVVSPYGITADGRGRVWLADPGSSAVHLFDLASGERKYIIRAGEVSLVSPVGVVYNTASDQLYIADSVLNRVFLLTADGRLIGERFVPGGFGRPAGLALDQDGRLYVADVTAGLIHVFAADGLFLRSIGSPDNQDGRFRLPISVAVDATGLIYVNDSMNFRIVVLSPTGELKSILGEIGTGIGTFARPRGVAVDSHGHVYVADAAFDNVQIFDMAGQLLLFFGQPGKGAGEFCMPSGVYVDTADRIYLAESCNQRFQVFQYLDSR
jgi:DNA-binding beta-propeller fold protein YncE